MRRCSVPGCRSNFSKPYVSVFTFPKDPILCKLWLKQIGRPTLKVHENIGVCIKHFERHLISGISSSEPHRKKVTIKHGAVPTIFEDDCSSYDSSNMEEKMQSPDKFARMQKNTKIPALSASGASVSRSPKKKDCDNKSPVRIRSPKKTSPTTDRPIITVIKVEDNQTALDKMDEDSNGTVDLTSSSASSFSLPSPFKNLPSVSVCLKEEDRVHFPRELKGVKRSLSTGSNSSTGSSETPKTATTFVPKRRKIEKPAPVVIGRQNDCYCWVCHRENIVLCCIACPRAFHSKCAGEVSSSSDWVCPECQRVLAAENVDSRSSTLAEISLDKLGALLKLSLNKMKQRAPVAFHQPVSLEHYPLYPHYVIYPMDFSLMEKNIKQKVYGCTEAFLADVKWIAHNSCVFNGTQHPLSTNAKNLVKSCDHDMQEIEVCPDCFVHSIVRNKYWFSEVCRKPHPLVWAKLKGFPYWPAKVARILDGNVDARFFGAHDRAWVPVSQCYHLSKEMPTTSKPKKKGNYEAALDELNVHVHLFIQKFGAFEYAPYRTLFNPQDNLLMYHGVDIDKACKEDISFDSAAAAASKLRFHSPEKENRFTGITDSESEKFNADYSKVDESLPEVSSAKAFQMPEQTSITSFLFKDKKPIDSSSILKESSKNEKDVTKESEEKKRDALETLTKKNSEGISDSDQLRKLELALERIKGYVSLNVDSEKENGEENEEEEKVKDVEKEQVSVETNVDEIKKVKVSSPLFKETLALPLIETNVSETFENVKVPLETTKKTDSFFLKLNETIASCKAKLGISEVTDELSSDNESVVDENVSRSEDEDDSSVSDADEENSSQDEAEDEDEEEAENMVASGDEAENGKKLADKAEQSSDNESDASDSESDEDSNSESSGTDIEECDTNAMSPKKSKNSIQDNPDYEDSVQEISDDNEASSSNLDSQDPGVRIDSSDALETAEESSSNPVIVNGTKNKENNVSIINLGDSRKKNQRSPDKNSTVEINSCLNTNGCSSYQAIKDTNVENSVISDNLNCSINKPQNLQDCLSPTKTISMLKENLEEQSTNLHQITPNTSHSSVASKNDPEEDDDIVICPQTKKSPPVIILDDDDDEEYEESSAPDTTVIKKSPHSTSAESLVTDEIFASKTNSDDELNDSAQKHMTINGNISKEALSDKIKSFNSENSVDPEKERKRKLRSEDSSDDDIQIVSPLKKPKLTGAIRTFNKPDNGHNLSSENPSQEIQNGNVEKENQIPVNSPLSSLSTSKDSDCDSTKQEKSSSIQNLLQNPVIDTSNLNDKDKEILFLKSKLNCILTAYHIQSWKCTQEREELRHNMNLIIMEMRACLESDKKQAIEALGQAFEQEKLKSIEETKKKQWCASCHMESRYACCWNTSYCSVNCQKNHFPEHKTICTQVKSKSISEVLEAKQMTATHSTDGTENKSKVIIVSMKPSDAAKITSDSTASPSPQQLPVKKPQIKIRPKSQQLQVVSSSNTATPLQFVFTPVKSATEPAPVASTQSVDAKDQHLDATRIINNVRTKNCSLDAAINLLTKKNMETSISFLKRKEESEKQKEEEKKKEEKNKAKEAKSLEEIYFPSPPKVTFEGYDSAEPEPNLIIEDFDDSNVNSDAETESFDKSDDVSPEKDVELSDMDADNDMDNEMIHIGRGITVKAKFLNKCLVYGQTPKKLTRCLVDVIFPDIKLLASCSAFGQKSNVTKLTRAALPARKVYSIIDYVTKRFPETTRSEIVLTINMKCKEARVILSHKESKQMTRRSLAREKKDELDTAVTSTSSTTSTTTTTTLSPPTSVPKTVPNVVCVKTNSTPLTSKMATFNLPKTTITSPNILRCSSQILIRPKPILTTVNNAAIVQGTAMKSPPRPNLLASSVNWPVGNVAKDGTKLVMSLGSTSTQPTTVSSTSTAGQRPYIIIGPAVNAVRQSTPVQHQHPTVSITSPVRK